jgi:hypothetical protein
MSVRDIIQAAAGVGGAAETDPNFNQTVLLLHGDGTNGAQNNTFLDGSTNNFTITRNGNTTQGTFSPFSVGAGEWSNYFGGSQSVSAAASSLFQASGDFTIEMWLYRTGTGDASAFVQGTSPYFALNVNAGTGFNIYLNSGGPTFSPTDIVPAVNTWNHIALVRSGSTVRVYLNGVASATTATNSSTLGFNSIAYVGAIGTQSAGSTIGYISNFRYVVGRAVYTSNFTPPTGPLGATSGGQNPPQGTETRLLTCQSNRFVDNSTNAFAITRNGNVRVTPFSPFAPSAAYDPAVNGGSGYFDGTGDFLTPPQNSVFNLSQGNWTIEGWFYPTSHNSGNARYIVATPASGNVLGLIPSGSGNSFAINQFGSGNVLTSSTAAILNAWQHVAIVRNGSTTTIYVNGVSAASGTVTWTNANTTIYFGSNQGSFSEQYFGYVSSARVVMGTALYTSAFTPPTAPLTAIANTQLLLNFTNAGVYDQTGKFVFETHNQVQISTAEKKFGTGSLAFDGTTDYISAFGTANQPPKQDMDMGTGNFTVECWLRTATPATTQTFFDTRPLSTNGPHITLGVNSSRIRFTTDSATRITSTTNLVADTWNHVALVRSSGSTKLYINGVNEGSTYTDNNNYVAGLFRIGLNSFGSESFNGYLDDIRVTKGVARYTANFTPPTKEFPDL